MGYYQRIIEKKVPLWSITKYYRVDYENDYYYNLAS